MEVSGRLAFPVNTLLLAQHLQVLKRLPLRERSLKCSFPHSSTHFQLVPYLQGELLISLSEVLKPSCLALYLRHVTPAPQLSLRDFPFTDTSDAPHLECLVML